MQTIFITEGGGVCLGSGGEREAKNECSSWLATENKIEEMTGTRPRRRVQQMEMRVVLLELGRMG